MKKTGIVTLLVMLAGFTSAAVIYQDDFSGSASSYLNGTTPDIGSGTWVGPTIDIMADGSGSGANSCNAYLPLTVETGEIYTMSVDVMMTYDAGNVSFVALCLNSPARAVTTHPAGGASERVFYYLLRAGGGIRVLDGNAYEETSGYTGTVTLTAVLDATDADTWTYEYFANGESVFTSSTASHGDGTYYLQLGNYAGCGAYTLDNLSVTTVPEPATIGLFGISAVAVLGLRRLQR